MAFRRSWYALSALGCSCVPSSSFFEPSASSQTTNQWYFYTGTLDPKVAATVKLFHCAETPIAQELSKYLGVPLSKMNVSRFQDGETSITIDDGVRGQKVYIVCSTTSVDRIMELLLAIAAMKRASAKSITAVIPFYGYGRQDRLVRGRRETIAAADIAHMLQISGVNHVLTVDLHSSQIEGFFLPTVPVDNLQAIPIGSIYFAEKELSRPAIIAPHESKVATALLFKDVMTKYYDGDDEIGIGMVSRQHLANDHSPPEHLLIGDVHDRDCIIVDTLVDTGNTLVNAAKLLKKEGARRVFAYAVHARLSGEGLRTIQNCKELDFLVITDTIPGSEELKKVLQEDSNQRKVDVLTVAPFLAEAIARIHGKGSMTEVFLP